ncbi:MAG TPA: MFS transporter [Pseudonocardia sp.]|uniref:MFS transporter n=1 Tax=Pseudonocardia sp. TaxID=60912 RepID=UPI002C92CBB2|nr:MFS transporter [Pseudonocardia sp.]HTF45854.1 MFS transporter [Pseudonocardia sp.]
MGIQASDTGGQTSEERGWFRSMTPRERRTFWGCFGGWAVDAMDVQIYSLVIPVLLSVHFLADRSEAGLIGTVTLLSSAAGGWLAGALSDRLGRVRVLQLTILWFSFSTLLCGFAQDGTQLLVFRALMGFGFGGEWVAGAVLMGETVRAQFRGRAVGTVQSGWAVGWGLAVLLSVLTEQLFAPEMAWRVLFGLGVLPALLVLYIRRHVTEPPLLRAPAGAPGEGPAAGPAPKAGFLAIFAPPQLPITVLCALVGVGAQGGYYAVTTWLPQFLAAERGLSILARGGTLALVIVGAFCGYLFGAWLSDRLGRRWAIVVCAVCSLAIVIPYTTGGLPGPLFTALCFPLGFFSASYFGGLGALFTEQFPTALRGSGQGFAYNFGRGVGAVFPFLVGVLADALSIGFAIALFAGAAYAVMAVAALLLPETRGKQLSEAA